MMQIILNKQKIRGLSLIELIVALAVSAIMLLGVTTVYTASQRTYQVNSELAKIQENARFALHILTSKIRLAGYTGCGNVDSIRLNILSNNIPAGFAAEDPALPIPISTFGQNNYITGHTHDGIWQPAFDAGLEPNNFEPGTDAITVRNASACSASVLTNNGKTLQITESCDFKQGDAVIVTDCKTADMFTIIKTEGGSSRGPHTLDYNSDEGATNKPMTANYSRQNRSKVLHANAVVYYIGNDDDGNLGLYEYRPSSPVPNQRLLIPNVENMLITYGLDADGDVTRTVDLEGKSAINISGMATVDYQTAIDKDDAQPTDTAWSRVVRVNMQLLLASDPVGKNIKPAIEFNGKKYEDDTRSRRVFNTSINIRNRTP